MNLDEIKARLMKMKALANDGVGGERANAEKLLHDLAETYGINLSDLDTEELEKFYFVFSRPWQRRLFCQLCGIMRQEKRKRGEVLRDKELELWSDRQGRGKHLKITFYTSATRCDILELTAKFEVLKADYKLQKKSFYLAFLMANGLLLDPSDDHPEPTPEERREFFEALRMSTGIRKSTLNKQLENKEAV